MKTRARLWFQADPEHHALCEGQFKRYLQPLLEKAGANEIAVDERPLRHDAFAVLFDAPSPAGAAALRDTLEADAAWRDAVARLANSDGLAGAEHWNIDVYAVEHPHGTIVEAGEGRRQGLWHNLSVRDGLPSAMIRGIMQDQRGDLWLYAYKGGVCRFDGCAFHQYTVDDGLPADIVFHVIESPDGRLWFATDKGLVRYDGDVMRVFSDADGLPAAGEGSYPSSTLWDLATPLWETSRSRLWCATPRGLMRIAEDEVKVFTKEDGLPDNAVTCLLEDSDGSIWCATPKGLARIAGNRIEVFTTTDGLPDNAVTRLLEDSEGSIWCATPKGPARIAGNRIEVFTAADGLPDQAIVPLLETRDGVIWFSTVDFETGQCALITFDGDRFTTLAARPGIPWMVVYGPGLEDSRGMLWFGALGEGLLCYDGVTFTGFKTEDGLSHNEAYALTEDRQGNIWVVSWGGGLGRYLGTHCRSYTTGDGLGHDTVEALCEDREGAIWFAHRFAGGASRFDGKGFTSLSMADGLGANQLWTIYQDRRGTLWFGTIGGGVSRYDGTTLTTFTTSDGLPDNGIMGMCEDSDGHMWFATQGGGAACYDGRTFTVLDRKNGLPDNMVWFVHQDHTGDMWFGPRESGITRYNGKTFKTLTRADGLTSNSIWCLHEDRNGQLWIGTQGGGVSRYDGTTFTNYTTQDGLPDDNIRALYEDGDGRIWMATYGAGIVVFDGDVFQCIDYNRGLAHNAAQDVLQDRNGNMWFATEGGVTRYTPLSWRPRVDLVDVVADRHYGTVDRLSVSVSQQIVRFLFRGRSFTTTPRQFAYRYRLEGYDDEWQTAYEGEVEYRNLPMGDYRFEVIAVDTDLNYSAPVCIELQVVPDRREDQIQALEAELFQAQGLRQFIGRSAALKTVLEQIRLLADTTVTGLILGETGTGKGMAARAVHALSDRKDQPFIHVNCGAIPEGLVESELFGHERGAFTGATTRKMGRFELAGGGTLFLDEIGDLPPASQQVLLHVLEEGVFQRVGGGRDIETNARILAATNRDLEQDMEAGTFREDLYYRINTFLLTMPPLRARYEDIPLLTEHFVEYFARHLHRPAPTVSPDVLTQLQTYHWPGNVRELEHLVQRAILICKDGVIHPEDIPISVSDLPSSSDDRFTSLRQHLAGSRAREKQLIAQALAATGGRVYGKRGAARLLDVNPEALRVKIRKYGLKP